MIDYWLEKLEEDLELIYSDEGRKKLEEEFMKSVAINIYKMMEKLDV